MTPRIYRPGITEIDEACAYLMVRSVGESKRYARAVGIVASGAIDFDATTGWTVASSSPAGRKAQTRYHVTPTTCECYDFKHTGGMGCKHIWAMQLYIRCLANALDASLRSPAAIEASATAQGWRAILELDPDDAIAAAEYRAAQPVDTRIEVLPGDASNRRNVYDRRTHVGICRAQQQPDGTWRPCAAVDTVAWARWLGAQQPVEVEEVAVAQPEPELVPAITSPYRYDQRQAQYGRAPVMQMQVDAAIRRHEAQAAPSAAELQYAALVAATKQKRADDARMIDELDRQFAR